MTIRSFRAHVIGLPWLFWFLTIFFWAREYYTSPTWMWGVTALLAGVTASRIGIEIERRLPDREASR